MKKLLLLTLLFLLISFRAFSGGYLPLGFSLKGLDEATCSFIGKNLWERQAALNKGQIPLEDHCGRHWDRPGYGISCDGSNTTNCLEARLKMKRMKLKEAADKNEADEERDRRKRERIINEMPAKIKNLKKQCEELGFKKGTKKFKNCVVELM